MTLMPFSKSIFRRFVSFTLSVKLSPSTDIPYTNAFSISYIFSGANINKKNEVHKFVDHKFVYQLIFLFSGASDGYDVEHGPRAAELIDQIRDTVLGFLDDKQIGLLKDACTFHTTCPRTGNPTIDACFDSDRLDLPRAGIIPDPTKMATKEGAGKADALRGTS